MKPIPCNPPADRRFKSKISMNDKNIPNIRKIKYNIIRDITRHQKNERDVLNG
jgi:hypothetical protein